MSRPLPHDACAPDVARRWSHVGWSRYSEYCGRFPPASDSPNVHLSLAGSTTCLSGFRDPKEAEDYREGLGLGPAWKLMDLRPDDAPSP